MLARIIPCYAADTSGVCSALYELGGMTVVHDASGCNSTYATHDEPRWYDRQSMIYISALTEMDAILGNDEKLIADTVSAAADQHPAFIAVCGSPMPMMTGVDFEAIAMEIQNRSGIPAFGLHTNGMQSYIDGASEAFRKLAEHFLQPCEKSAQVSVNIIGATPLDFALHGTVSSLQDFLTENGFTMQSCMAMDSSLAQISGAAAASVNLVISSTGLETAVYLQERFGIPYVCGIPAGVHCTRRLAEELHQAVRTGESLSPCTPEQISGETPYAVVIGERITSQAIAFEIQSLTGKPVQVIAAPNAQEDSLSQEEGLQAYLAANRPALAVADPLYRYILPEGTRQIELPHFAFSGRCFDKRIPNLMQLHLEEYCT